MTRDPDRGGGPTAETAGHHLPTTTRHHPSGVSMVNPRRAHSASWPTIACLDRACLYCRCGRSRELEPERPDDE